ncbi:MAG: anti-sigma factor family protein, partial [Gemmatimonadaceae bacterium]
MQHLDEGMIHAWLDGALSAEESERVEAHVASCAACGALVAEARGLVAASSRILAALDNVPREVIPSAATSGGAASAVTKPRPGPRVPLARIAAAVAFVAVGGLALRIATGGSGDLGVASRAVEQEQLGVSDTVRATATPRPVPAAGMPATDSTALRGSAELAGGRSAAHDPLTEA